MQIVHHLLYLVMFINWHEWKMIKVFNTVDSIKPEHLTKSFSDFSEPKLKKTLDSLISRGIVNFFWVGSVYKQYSSYNLLSSGKRIAKRGFFKHNALELFSVIDKNKAWIPIAVGIVGLIIALRKC